MNYLILTETEFFGLINGNDETINLNAAYGCFVKAVVELLSDNKCHHYLHPIQVPLLLPILSLH